MPQIVPSVMCFRCDVCCRFPEADSFLRPYFTAEEIREAVARGIDPAQFSHPDGGQVSLVPHPAGEGYLCPAFDPATSHCRIYEVRPLDCQLYPLALMWSADQSAVVLGWDTKCPFMREAVPADIRVHAERVTDLIEGPYLETVAANPRLIGRFQDDVVVLTPLSKLTAHIGATATALRPLRVGDRDRLEQACAAVDTPLAHYALAPHLIWSGLFRYAWTECAGRFCLFADYADGQFMPLPPLGPEPDRAAFKQAFAVMRKRNGDRPVGRMENVPEAWSATLEGWGYRVTPKEPDYLYRTTDLIGLAGDRYKSQRAACNRVVREHRCEWRPYRSGDRDACLALFQRWRGQQEARPVGEAARLMLADAESAHREALSRAEALGLTGRVASVDGEVLAYTFSYARSRTVRCVLLEVADRTIPGLAQWVFRESCREAAGQGYEFINTMDDSGLPALAAAKRAYHPLRLVPSFIASEP